VVLAAEKSDPASLPRSRPRATVAARTRDQIALALLGRRVREGVGGAPDGIPQCVGELAQLVLDHHLLEHGQAGAAELGRRIDRLQARVEHRRLDRCMRLGAEPVVTFAFVFEPDDLLGERAGAVLQFGQPRCVCEFH